MKSDAQFDGPVAIIAGSGRLPSILVAACRRSRRPVQMVKFGSPDTTGDTEIAVKTDGTKAPDVDGSVPVIQAEFERPGRVFRQLRQLNCRDVVFAGSVRRPVLDARRFDETLTREGSALLDAMKRGDDVTLRTIRRIFEREGFRILGPQHLDSEVLPEPGVLTSHRPTRQDTADGARAARIHESLGKADVGQAVVVAQGLCVGVETAQGTGPMLAFVAETIESLRWNPEGGRGILYKAAKPGQDRLMDMPAIGPDTVGAAASAGLSGIILAAGDVLVLDIEECLRRARESGVFIWNCRDGELAG